MRVLVQRVSEANVSIQGEIIAQIGWGLLIFVGVRHDDDKAQADCLARKIVRLRIFPDDEARMNKSVADVSGEMLIVSQFTLYGDTRKGNRPSYSEAASPGPAKELYEYFVTACRSQGVRVLTGEFQAHMQVQLINDGPVTLMCYSERQEHQN